MRTATENAMLHDEMTLEQLAADDQYAAAMCDQAEMDAELANLRAMNAAHATIDPSPAIPWSDTTPTLTPAEIEAWFNCPDDVRLSVPA